MRIKHSDDFVRTHTKRGGRQTSVDGARDVQFRAESQMGRLLKVYAANPTRGYMSNEAAHLAGISPFSTHWHRVGDLERLGLLKIVLDDDGQPMKRMGDRGSKKMVYQVTPAGIRRARELDRP